jgi:hypothetical protein
VAEQASAPIPVGDASAAVVFPIADRRSVEVQVRFYADARGTVPLSVADGGARDAVLLRVESVRLEDVDAEPEQISANAASSSWSAAGGVWQLVGVGAGAERVRVEISGGSNPVGAASLRVLVNA